jgi:hypothetical protein
MTYRVDTARVGSRYVASCGLRTRHFNREPFGIRPERLADAILPAVCLLRLTRDTSLAPQSVHAPSGTIDIRPRAAFHAMLRSHIIRYTPRAAQQCDPTGGLSRAALPAILPSGPSRHEPRAAREPDLTIVHASLLYE